MSEITDLIRKMIEDALQSSEWTSASPGHTNTLKKLNFSVDADFAPALDEIIPQTEEGRKLDDSTETVDRYKRSGVDEVSRYTTGQMGDLNSFVQNPFGFIVSVFSRSLVRGVGVAAIAIALAKLIETVFRELMEPGREFDVRFREVAADEILKFTDAREQAEIRSGISRNIIVTTIGGLRGDGAVGQIGGSFWTPQAVPANRLDPKVVASKSPESEGLGSSIISGRGKTGGGAGVARARQ